MKLFGYIGVALALALASTSTLAFQEQGGGPVAEQPAPSAKAPDANLSATKPDAGAAGTEVRIPGLGKLGVLPKMDFGLELLYGASDAKQPEPEQGTADDLMIRGTVKHKF